MRAQTPVTRALASLELAIMHAERAQCQCAPASEEWLGWEAEARAYRDRIDRIRNGNDNVCRQVDAQEPAAYRPYNTSRAR